MRVPLEKFGRFGRSCPPLFLEEQDPPLFQSQSASSAFFEVVSALFFIPLPSSSLRAFLLFRPFLPRETIAPSAKMARAPSQSSGWLSPTTFTLSTLIPPSSDEPPLQASRCLSQDHNQEGTRLSSYVHCDSLPFVEKMGLVRAFFFYALHRTPDVYDRDHS